MDRAAKRAGHAFISYVREDASHVDVLQGILEVAGIPVWRDTADLWPGQDWRARIRSAIRDEALVFIACFSQASVARQRSYQNEELLLAIEELRRRAPDEPWLIPVRFDECDIPDRDIGGGRTLNSIQRADLFGAGASDSAARLVTVVHRMLRQRGDDRTGDGADIANEPLPSASSLLKPDQRHDNGGFEGSRMPESHLITATRLKIGLLGSAASGKSTFLAALSTAATNAGGTAGHWNIFPLNSAAEEFMTMSFDSLMIKGHFPQEDVHGTLQMLFAGDWTGTKYVPRRAVSRRHREIRFALDLVKVGFGPPGSESISVPTTNSIDELVGAYGLVYLLDPVREGTTEAGAVSLSRILAILSRNVTVSDRPPGGYLPHYLSVCVTKFDHPDVFQHMRRMGLVNYDSNGLPRVSDEHAEIAFKALCNGSFWSDSHRRDSAHYRYIDEQLRRYFHPDRTRYFVTSSIGFWQPPRWVPEIARSSFNPHDFHNCDTPHIRGSIHPVNVIEPFISILSRAARSSIP